jgi:hypothetical protein
MKRAFAVLALLALVSGPVMASPDDHVVSRATIDQKLAGAAADRARNLASVNEALSSPNAARAAASVGVDVDRVRRALPRLSDADLRDLSKRAAALRTDPLSGHRRHYHDYDDSVELLLLVALIGAIALIVIHAAER